mgnify:CR=1 FL=1
MVLKFCLPAIDHAEGTASRLAVSGSQGTRRRSLRRRAARRYIAIPGAPRGRLSRPPRFLHISCRQAIESIRLPIPTAFTIAEALEGRGRPGRMPDALRLKASVQSSPARAAGGWGRGEASGKGRDAAKNGAAIDTHPRPPQASRKRRPPTPPLKPPALGGSRRPPSEPIRTHQPAMSRGRGAESAHRKRGPNNGRRPRKTEPSSNGVEPSLALAASQSNPKRVPRANRTTWPQADNRITWRQARKSRFAQVSHGRGRFASASPCRLRATSTRAAKAHAPEITRQSAGPASGTLTGR